MSDAQSLAEFVSPDDEYSIVIDEDREVCYAYLKQRGNMVAHAWLYNRGGTPADPQWKEKEQCPPFKNSHNFVAPVDFPLPDDLSCFTVEWFDGSAENDLIAEVRIGEVLVAKFLRGHNIGQSRLAVRSNVLAVPLVDLHWDAV